MKHQTVFLKACRGEPVPHTPIWLMRQAGRYMQEYRSVRDKVSFLELCKNPELVCDVTVTAAHVLNLDAAIIFADILLIVEALGYHLEFGKGEGPKITPCIRSLDDLKHLAHAPGVETLSYVGEGIKETQKALKPHIPLIGFAGPPFTVAAYMIEGGGSKHFENTKILMRSHPQAWNQLMTAITQATLSYLDMQIQSGADALQLFDSWVGNVTALEYELHVKPYVQDIFKTLHAKYPELPLIYFGTNSDHLIPSLVQTHATVLSLDHRSSFTAVSKQTRMALQGNLDPLYLLGPVEDMKKDARRILDEVKTLPNGFIFNLGHGILPTTPVDHVKALIEFVHLG